MRLLPVVAAVTAAFLVVACSSPTPPKGVTVVNNFDAKRYLGTWYEIARLDHRFERGLEQVTATYSLRDDGGINVINKGYNPDREMWQKTEGKAYFTGSPNRAALKVSFFGTVAKLAMRQPFVLFKGLTFQKLCLPGAFRPGDHHNK
ncbi:lipocalin family protein, partial [Salmonella enterica subsp. enterica serovar Enteritidis]|nr:lipocalin family protein [Salmonella enterica subsp. enterica serovar Enteritidis]